MRDMNVTDRFNPEEPGCCKCGSDDFVFDYRSPGFQGFAEEHLHYKCDECGFEWRTLTKDAQ